MSKRDPLLDRCYMRLEAIIASYNEDIQEENEDLKELLAKVQERNKFLKEENEKLKDALKIQEGHISETLASLQKKPSEEAMMTYFNLVKTKEKIRAIKDFRSMTGWGLKESKQFTDMISMLIHS